MEKKITFLIAVFVGIGSLMLGQSYKILVKRGGVTEGKTYHGTGEIFAVNEGSVVYVDPGTLSFVAMPGKILELKANKNYKFGDLVEMFNTKLSYTGAFVDVISSQDYSFEKKSGISTRGESSQTYVSCSPTDSVTVLCDSVMLAISCDGCKLISDILLTGPNGENTIKVSNDLYTYPVHSLKSGFYRWTCNLMSTENTELTVDNLFYVPTFSELEPLSKEWMLFNSEITAFSKPMQAQLMLEYSASHKVYSCD
jgi:hypothetical protein